MIIVLNFGGQTCHLIAKRVRAFGVYAEILPSTTTLLEIKRHAPSGIILSGGPSSVYEQNAPLPDDHIFASKLPILGICYGHQLIGKRYGKVINKQTKEYGKRIITVKKTGRLLQGLGKQEQAWMSHGDQILRLPADFQVLATTPSCRYAAAESNERKLYGVQFHPEVIHTKKGDRILKNFVINICKSKRDFSIKSLPSKLIQHIKQTVKNDSVIMGTSGGVDSTVAATLIHKAIGKNLHCVFIDSGLIRKHEAKEVRQAFLKLQFHHFYMVDASKLFLRKLKGVKDPERKRKIIGHTYVEVFEKKAKELEKKHKNIKFLGQGTIYPDRIESAQPNKAASKIKSHHNLTLPEKMRLKVIEPLQDLYKDDVRKLGNELKINKDLLARHPFPGPGLAIRILGEITQEKIRILQETDYIFIEELKKANYYGKTWQALAALLPVKAVGVMGDARTYEYMVALRAVTSVDAMTADWAKLPDYLLETIGSRIVNEVKGVNRVLYDITQKPPATIEYE